MKYEEYPRVALQVGGATKFGFLVYADSERDEHRVRILRLFKETEMTLPLKDIIGFVGMTFEQSIPARPEVCERVVFFDGGRQRKGWVWDVERNGKVTLLVDYYEVYPPGKPPEEVRPEEMETVMEFEERWLEELVLFPVGQGFRRLSDEEVDGLVKNAMKEVGDSAPSGVGHSNGNGSNGTRTTLGMKGGTDNELAVKAARGVERLRGLMAKVTTTKGA